jgi:WD40 repeat protein
VINIANIGIRQMLLASALVMAASGEASASAPIAVITQAGLPYFASPQAANSKPLGQFAFNTHVCITGKVYTWNRRQFLQYVLPSGELVYTLAVKGIIARDPAGNESCRSNVASTTLPANIPPPVQPAPQQPATTPILRPDVGMHTSPIYAMSVDAAGRLLLTASEDKTARLWSLPDGHLLTVLRPPQDFGKEGQLFGAALSPDGATAAVGGWTGASWGHLYCVYLFETATGRMLRRLSIDQKTEVINYLAFSPDGRFLVVGLLGNSGIRVWRTNGWALVGQDTDYGEPVYGAAFDRSDRLVTSSFDGFIRLYDPSFHLIAKAKAPGGAQPNQVSFSPDGHQIAVGYNDAGDIRYRVDVVSGQDLRPLFVPDGPPPPRGSYGYVNHVTWSSDGRTLYAAGLIYQDRNSVIRAWPDAGHGVSRDLPIATTDAVSSLQPLPGGGVAFATADPAWATIENASPVAQQRMLADFRGVRGDNRQEYFRLSADGLTVAFGFEYGGRRPAVWTFRSVAEPASSLDAPMQSAPGMSVNSDWGSESNTLPKLNGHPLALENYETPSALAIRGHKLLLGTSWFLRLFDQSGRELWRQTSPSMTWSVNLSADGRLAVAAFGDGTIRWYRSSDGQELLAFFPHNDRKRWVVFTPSGYYDASPGGEDLIGWHVNRGPDQAADFFPASRFHDRLYRPDVINQVLATLDEGEAVKLANTAAERNDARITPELIATLAPPVLELVDAPTRFATDHVTIKYRVRNPADAGSIDSPRIMVNGEWQPTSRGFSLLAADGTQDVHIGPLPPHDSTVKIYADNSNARSEPLTIELQWDGRAAFAPGQQGSAAQRKSHLFVLAVGISEYQRPELRLNFADRDAKQFVAAMQAQRGKLYAEVNSKLLVNGDATLKNVEDGLAWLQSQAAEDDVGILFLAGHGFQLPDKEYFYAPADFDPQRPRDTGIDYKTIRQTLVKFGGAGNKAIFLIDTCYAGSALGPNLSASSADSLATQLSRPEFSVVVLSASSGDQLSYEDAQWGDGAFTKALLEGVTEGKADPAQTGEITVFDLSSYVTKRVKVLTEQRQIPRLLMPSGGVEDFVIATH